MYENLVAWLRDKDFEPICPCGDESICEGKDCAVLQAADAIEQLQGRAKVLEKIADKWCDAVPKWIPVTERLPQIGRNVLMFSTKGRCAEGEFSGNGWWQYRWGAWINSQEVTHWMPLPGGAWINSQEVTHWMPLPDPPKGGADG